MEICNYFRGATDKVTGFTYDTERKTYTDFVLKSNEWDPKTIKLPGDVKYFFPTLRDLKNCKKQIIQLGFVRFVHDAERINKW